MKSLGIVGSYRKGGTIDSAVSAVLEGTNDSGYKSEKVYLSDLDIRFCTNCRTCTQDTGEAPGTCVIDDDMAELIAKCDAADFLVLGSPVNLSSATAITKTFAERCAPMVYWPWGAMAPKKRRRKAPRPAAVIITSSGVPAFIGTRIFTANKTLRDIADMFDARVVKELSYGMAARSQHGGLSDKQLKAAHAVGDRQGWWRGLDLRSYLDVPRAMLR